MIHTSTPQAPSIDDVGLDYEQVTDTYRLFIYDEDRNIIAQLQCASEPFEFACRKFVEYATWTKDPLAFRRQEINTRLEPLRKRLADKTEDEILSIFSEHQGTTANVE